MYCELTLFMLTLYCKSSYITGALSVIDDYCISYTVAVVDVRSCTRPPRILNQQPISEPPHIFVPTRSPDLTHTSECAYISRQPGTVSTQSSTSTSIGELCHVIIKYVHE